jgi:hypothetical protein
MDRLRHSARRGPHRGGAASGGGAIKLFKDWKDELAKKRADCATARAAFIAAKDKLMNDCPTECWPRPFPDLNCP